MADSSPVYPFVGGKRQTKRYYQDPTEKPDQDRHAPGFSGWNVEDLRQYQDGHRLDAAADPGQLDYAAKSHEPYENHDLVQAEPGRSGHGAEHAVVGPHDNHPFENRVDH